jgi:hypothetical protein
MHSACLRFAVVATFALTPFSLFAAEPVGRTEVSIRGEMFYINGKPTYEGRTWQGKKIEGLLMNSRMV